MEKHIKRHKDLFLTFVDLEKAYDKVPRKVLYWAIRKGVQEKPIKIVMEMYKQANTKVRTSKGLLDCLDIEVSLHQRSVLSHFLFILLVDVLSEELQTEDGLDKVTICR